MRNEYTQIYVRRNRTICTKKATKQGASVEDEGILIALLTYCDNDHGIRLRRRQFKMSPLHFCRVHAYRDLGHDSFEELRFRWLAGSSQFHSSTASTSGSKRGRIVVGKLQQYEKHAICFISFMYVSALRTLAGRISSASRKVTLFLGGSFG